MKEFKVGKHERGACIDSAGAGGGWSPFLDGGIICS